MFISTRGTIATTRNEKEPGPLDIEVALGDVIFLAIHPFIWITLIILFQNNGFRCLRAKDKQTENDEELDDDVIA